MVSEAEAHPISLEAFTLLQSGEALPTDLCPNREVIIPMGFKIVYTVEVQPAGALKHMSMSITLPGRVPHPEAVEMIMEEMGFVNPLSDCLWYEEQCGGGQMAINVMEPLDGDWTPFRKASNSPSSTSTRDTTTLGGRSPSSDP